MRPTGASRREDAFVPEFHIDQTAGAPVDQLQYRLSALGSTGQWRQVSAADPPRALISEKFDLRQYAQVHVGDLWFHIRFPWRDAWLHERHRWPLRRIAAPGKVLWDLGDELVPPQRCSSQSPDDVAPPGGAGESPHD